MNDGGPAFPLGITSEMESVGVSQNGMSLRDYFAAAAMQSFLSSHEFSRDVFAAVAEENDDIGKQREIIEHVLASRSYRMADALLAQRDK